MNSVDCTEKLEYQHSGTQTFIQDLKKKDETMISS